MDTNTMLLLLISLFLGIIAGVFLQRLLLNKKCEKKECNVTIPIYKYNNDIQFSEDKIHDVTIKKLNEIDLIRDYDLLNNTSFQEPIKQIANVFLSTYESSLTCMVKHTNELLNKKSGGSLSDYQISKIDQDIENCIDNIEYDVDNIVVNFVDSITTTMMQTFRNVLDIAEKGTFDDYDWARSLNINQETAPGFKENLDDLEMEIRKQINLYRQQT